jgi:hypothetical protein
MTRADLKSRKKELALAIADGLSIKEWASQNGVAESNAYRWAKQSNVKTVVNSRRRVPVDQALSILGRQLPSAVDTMARLGETAASESVQLGAVKALCSHFERLHKNMGLEQRLTELEDQLRERLGIDVSTFKRRS